MDILTKSLDATSVYVKPVGRIDINTAMEFGQKVNDEVDGMINLVIDFAEVDYISSIGLRVLLELQKRMKEQGSMKLMNVQDEVMNIFTMTGFNKILTIL